MAASGFGMAICRALLRERADLSPRDVLNTLVLLGRSAWRLHFATPIWSSKTLAKLPEGLSWSFYQPYESLHRYQGRESGIQSDCPENVQELLKARESSQLCSLKIWTLPIDHSLLLSYTDTLRISRMWIEVFLDLLEPQAGDLASSRRKIHGDLECSTQPSFQLKVNVDTFARWKILPNSSSQARWKALHLPIWHLLCGWHGKSLLQKNLGTIDFRLRLIWWVTNWKNN